MRANCRTVRFRGQLWLVFRLAISLGRLTMKSETIRKIAVLAATAIITAVTLSSCVLRSKEKTLYEKIVNTLTKTESFQTEAYVAYISNNKRNNYYTLQQARASGEYRIEVTAPEEAAGNITVFDGKIISQYNKKINGKISVGTTESMERSEILLTSFIKNYLASDDVSVSVSSIDAEKETVLEAKIPGNNRYFATEKLWMNNDTLTPNTLIIYDVDGKERIIVNYQKFEYNVKLEDSVFTVNN